MRVNVVGMSEPAKALRGHLRSLSDVAVVERMADYTVAIVPSTEPHVTVDGSASALETGIVNQLADILGSVLVRREEGRKLPADTVVVGIPAGMEADAERALFRAIAGRPRKPAWLQRVGWLLLAFLLPATAHAQGIVAVKCHNGTTAFFCGDSVNSALRVNVVASSAGGGAVTQGAGFGAATGYWNTRLTDGTNFYVALTDTQLRATPVPVSGTVTATPTGTQDVNCVSGCVAGGSFADAAAFTFGTTAVGLSAFVVDDVATNSVSENSAGAARMNGSRILYVDLSKTAANATPIVVGDGTGALNVIVDSATIANLDVALSTRLKPADTLTAVTTVGTITNVVHVDDNTGSLTVDAPVGTPVFTRLSDGAAALIGSKVSASSLPVVIASDQGTVPTSISAGNFPDNEPFNLAQVNGQTVNVGTGAAGTGTQRVTTSTDSTIGTVTTITNAVTVAQATAANLNVREDTSGATGAAVPARADYIGLNDGTNVIGQKAVSATNNTTTIVTGMQLATPIATWCVNHLPATATKATISRAAGAAGVRHVLTTYGACFACGATAGPVQTFTVRDGATGAGTVIATGALACPVNDSQCTGGTLNFTGTAATAATIEFGAAGAAATIETVWLCGYDVQ